MTVKRVKSDSPIVWTNGLRFVVMLELQVVSSEMRDLFIKGQYSSELERRNRAVRCCASTVSSKSVAAP